MEGDEGGGGGGVRGMRVEGDEGGGGGGVRVEGVRGSDRKRLEKEREGDDLDSCRTVSQL